VILEKNVETLVSLKISIQGKINKNYGKQWC
jgi:hypothetical protein